MDVRVEGDRNRTAGEIYVEDRSVRTVHLSIENLSIEVGAPTAAGASQARNLQMQDLHTRRAYLREVRRALRRRFVRHRTVLVFLACCALFIFALLMGWGAPPHSLRGALVLMVGIGCVIPSMFWMARERTALYAELRRNKEERFELECALVRVEAETEALRNRQARG